MIDYTNKESIVMNYAPKKISISMWAEEDRPREKLKSWGKNSLSDVEILAIIIGSGNKNLTAIDLAQQILDHSKGKLYNLAKMNLNDLMKFKGIGPAKAINIVSSFELGKRALSFEVSSNPKFTCSRDGYVLLKNRLGDLEHEEFWILLLSKSNKLIRKERISIGGVSATLVDPKIIFSKALNYLASSIILAHNHPSGNLMPSQSDIQLTRKLSAAARLFDIKILDHLILTDQNYYSFADEGIL